MSHSHQAKSMFLALFIAAGAYAQNTAGATNNLPNPYRAVENWAQLPANIQWAQVISVDPDAHGNIWVSTAASPTSSSSIRRASS